jgi:microcystin degradation protein MlrC
MTRIAVGAFLHETNTFAPTKATYDDFVHGGGWPSMARGADVLKVMRRINVGLAGFVEAAEANGWELVPTISAAAVPSAHVTRDAFERIMKEMVDGIAAAGPIDAVYLDLHGAMVTEDYDDGEGETLARVRKVIGNDLPLVVSLDLHANVSPEMMAHADALIAYRTYPHIDMADTARRSGRTLMRMLAGEVEPRMVWGNRPIMSSSLVHTPSREPMKTLMGMANQAEDTGQVLNASVFGGFPQADIPHLALSSVIVCDKRTAEGEILLNKILDAAWEKREGFLFHPEPLSVQVARAKSLDGGPIVMADHGDNTASGGTQDVMSVIEEAMKQGLEDACAGPICDPGCVEQMIKAGVGAEVTLELGGKIDMPAMGLKGKPLKVTGKVKAITDGQFVVTGPMATGTTARMGRTAVLDTGKMQIVVSERRAEPYDLGVFTHCGIDPRRKKYVLIKSRQHFRAGFEPIAKHIVMCDGDGCTASDLKLFKYTKVKRPLYPFDLDMRLGRNEA